MTESDHSNGGNEPFLYEIAKNGADTFYSVLPRILALTEEYGGWLLVPDNLRKPLASTANSAGYTYERGSDSWTQSHPH